MDDGFSLPGDSPSTLGQCHRAEYEHGAEAYAQAAEQIRKAGWKTFALIVVPRILLLTFAVMFSNTVLFFYNAMWLGLLTPFL